MAISEWSNHNNDDILILEVHLIYVIKISIKLDLH